MPLPTFPLRLSLLPASLGLSLLVGACSTTSVIEERDGIDHSFPPPADIDRIPDAVPKVEPLSRYGNPERYTVFGKEYQTLSERGNYRERGIASWYGSKFHGRRTSSGEAYDMYAMTAAHKSLPLPTYARVTNLQNGQSVVVKINDRGPFHDNRLIDLSYTAAWKLGIAGPGTGLVEVEALDPAAPEPKPEPKPVQIGSGLPEIFLQVGAFGSAHNANRLKTRLQSQLDTEVWIQQTLSDDPPLFRVQVGPIASIELCDNLADKLNGLGIPETRLVIR
ncbi:MAG: septal ring lytic transglycosylase RlpA family protein [Gammaproteobacteria bacterium]|nr:septal ring lytic transglycosylase RlpA family protein [Gammaproteobacteria bacterium]